MLRKNVIKALENNFDVGFVQFLDKIENEKKDFFLYAWEATTVE